MRPRAVSSPAGNIHRSPSFWNTTVHLPSYNFPEGIKEPHLLQHFTSITQNHRSTLTAPQPPPGSPISLPRPQHHVSHTFQPRSSKRPELQLAPRRHRVPVHLSASAPAQPRAWLGGARRWAGGGEGVKVGGDRLGVGWGPPLPRLPDPPARDKKRRGAEASPTAPPLPGGRAALP